MTTKTTGTATDAFIDNQTEAIRLAERIRIGLDAYSVQDGERIHWGHVGDMAEYVKQLRRVSDALYHEGEHSPSAQ